MPKTKRRVAVYCLESSDTCGTPVDRYLWHTCREGAAVLAGAPDLTVAMPVLAYKKAIIENYDVCIGLWCLYWSVFDLV